MKTPEEIKRGLKMCGVIRGRCKGCPYDGEAECVSSHSADALAYIQQLEAQVPKWISVEERLPTPEDTSANGLVICVCRGEDDKPIAEEVHAWHVDVVRRMTPCFTHWMPMNQLFPLLPEPPKEG